jgi:8-oxo-dGTP pyrophosphatase MutT (NUDIX family)
MSRLPADFARLHRHVLACNNIASPAGLLPFRLSGQQVGWIAPDLARWLAFRPRDFHFDRDGVTLARSLRGAGAAAMALDRTARALAEQGAITYRAEPFDIRATPDGPVLGRLDRGAVPSFGVIGQGVHVNGFVRRADGLHLWCGVRARTKSVAPGQLDHIVAGGIPAGLSPRECLVKEAAEEASIPPELAATAVATGRVSYVLRNAEGLRRDVLHVFDLELPADVTPTPQDGEVERFELWPAAALLEEVLARDNIKFNVNLVLIDFFLRHALLDLPEAEAAALAAELDQVA